MPKPSRCRKRSRKLNKTSGRVDSTSTMPSPPFGEARTSTRMASPAPTGTSSPLSESYRRISRTA